MYTLYGMTGSCSLAVHVLLNEVGAKYDYVDVRVPAGQPKPAEFLKANPRGSVPVLVEGATIIREGGAIITYLLDAHSSPLLPKSGPERAKALEWLMFANATLHPVYSRAYGPAGVADSDEAKQEVVAKAGKRINELWADVDAQLAKTKYVAGDLPTAGDFLLTVIANWVPSGLSGQITLGNNVKRLVREISGRPAFQQALQAEKIEYKAAA